jgi:hypothetical protein
MGFATNPFLLLMLSHARKLLSDSLRAGAFYSIPVGLYSPWIPIHKPRAVFPTALAVSLAFFRPFVLFSLSTTRKGKIIGGTNNEKDFCTDPGDADGIRPVRLRRRIR